MYYHTLNEEPRRRFGWKVYKLALDGGFTCPNRDGTIGAGAAAFSVPGTVPAPLPPTAHWTFRQIEAAKRA
ncbi:MAG: hypothetical protein ACLUNO_06850 [Oscillospiraceae bacterium]